MFAVERSVAGGREWVTVTGEVDIDTAPQLAAALIESAVAGRRVVVDLGAVTFLDAAGLTALLSAHHVARQTNGSIVLRTVPRMVARILSITGLDQVLTIESSPRSPEPQPDPGP